MSAHNIMASSRNKKTCQFQAILMDKWTFDHLFVCFEVFGPVNPMGSCLAWSVYLTTHLPGSLSPLDS